MDYYRISMVLDNGRLVVRDLAFSQTIGLIDELNSDEKEKFWSKKQVTLHNSTVLKLIGNV